MPITGIEAAEVAKRHGLGMAEAASLRVLADSAEEADELAQSFAPPLTEDAFAAALAAKLPPRPTAEEIETTDPFTASLTQLLIPIGEADFEAVFAALVGRHDMSPPVEPIAPQDLADYLRGALEAGDPTPDPSPVAPRSGSAPAAPTTPQDEMLRALVEKVPPRPRR